jgi:hypothetical protein
MSWPIKSEALKGVTGTSQAELQRIRVPITADIRRNMVNGTVTYLFLTFDAGSRVTVGSGGFTYIDRANATVGEHPNWVQQTAVLLKSSNAASASESEVVLNIVLTQAAPVKWRGVMVTVLGQALNATLVGYKDRVNTPIAVDPTGGTACSVIFFGHDSKTLVIDDNATPVNSVQDEGYVVEAYTWGTADVGGALGGPWFTATVESSVPVPPAPPVQRPLPVDAETFWAYPSCCQCGDVFIINNDQMAKAWDAEGSMALEQGDTLLLNHTDSDGTRWSLTDIQGWWTLPPAELPELKNSGYLDGSFPIDGRYNARQITVSGVFLPGPDVNVAVPRQRLLRALDAVRGGALFVAKEPVWAKQSWVYLQDSPKIDTKGASQLTMFEFTLRAVDPIKYHAGTVGFQQVELVDASAGYRGRTYSTEREVVPATAEFNWIDTLSGAPGAGNITTSGEFFDDVQQDIFIDDHAYDGSFADFSEILPGHRFTIVETLTLSEHRLEGVVQSVEPQDGGAWWKITVRRNPSPLIPPSTHSKPDGSSLPAHVQVTWTTQGTRYSDDAVARGLRFRPPPPDPTDLSLPPNPWRRYQKEVEPTSVTLINAGTTPVMPRVYVYGPCSNPAVVNQTTQQRMQFIGEVLDGEVLVADCLWRLVLIRDAGIGPSLDPRGDLAGYNRRWKLDLRSDWISLVPGKNVLTMEMSTSGPNARVVVAYRSGWLG